jgi:hypothetical protein
LVKLSPEKIALKLFFKEVAVKPFLRMGMITSSLRVFDKTFFKRFSLKPFLKKVGASFNILMPSGT